MDLFTKLFGHPLLFVYHCFDRIVILGTAFPQALRDSFLPVTYRRYVGVLPVGRLSHV
jgi:hypothetical protein